MGILQKLKDTKAFFEDLESVEDKSFAEVVLEAAGVNVPLPTEDEVIEFYTEVGEPTNPLTKIDPKEWTTSQFLAYQSDVRKFQRHYPNWKHTYTIEQIIEEIIDALRYRIG